jgi:hypothetical protein
MAQANPQGVSAQQPTTYQDLYLRMPDTLNGVYAAYLTPFGAESVEQPVALRDQVIATVNDIPKVFAIMQTNPTPCIVFIHRPTRYAPSLLGTQLWDDHIFGFQGDLLPRNQINTVEWPMNPFTWTVNMMVSTLATMDMAWVNVGGNDAIRPLGTNDPATEQLCAQFLCPVPHWCVQLCLCQSYMPRSFWTNIIRQVLQDQQGLDCAMLVNWA